MKTHRNHIVRISALALLLPAALLGTASCGVKEEVSVQDGPQEIAFSLTEDPVTLDGPATRGYVTGSTLVDNVTGPRSLRATAYLHPQVGEAQTYLENEEFVMSGDSWRRTPPVYWPMGGRLDFMVYSSGVPFEPEAIVWGAGNSAERMRIAVGRDHLQDDVLFGSSWGSVSSAGVPTALTLHHCQAWIEVSLKMKEGAAETVTVDAVSLKNVYYDGILNIENNFGNPQMAWDFRGSEGRDRLVDDPQGVFGTTLTETASFVRMLIPEQEMTSIVVDYTIDGESKRSVTALPHMNWIAGRKYVYEYEFGTEPPASIGGMIVAPCNLMWDGTDFVIPYGDWNHSSYNSVYGLNAGSYYFNFVELGSRFDSRGSSFDASSGSIDNANLLSWGGYDDWRVPTQSDVAKLVAVSTSVRSGSTVNGSANRHFSHVRLSDVSHAGSSSPEGLLLFPDGKVITGVNLGYYDQCHISNTITSAQLDVYLSQGCAFLPSSSYSYGSWMSMVMGNYWAATEASSTTAYRLFIPYGSSNDVIPDSFNMNKTSYYLSVRLVRDL